MATKTVRAPMPRSKRAKQFMPFDALTGLREAIAAKERVPEPRRYPSEEAIAEIELAFDRAQLSHIHIISIIHGKGTGALRKGLHQWLKRLPYVKSYRLGAYGEGDAGVTIVTFK